MKPSDEQVQKWHSEYHNFNMPWASDQIEFAKYIAALAYAAGRESMREEVVKLCDNLAQERVARALLGVRPQLRRSNPQPTNQRGRQ